MVVPVNPSLSSSWEVPGIYFALDLSGSGSGLGTLAKRLLLVANRLATGTQPPDAPVLVNGQSDANAFYGRGSDLARLFAAAQSQVGSGVIDIFCVGINEPSSGTQATHLIIVAGTATAAGSVDCYVAGYRASIAIANGDAAATVAANLAAALQALKDLPVTVGVAGGTITLTYVHKGTVGNDLPIRIDQSFGAGITFSPGTVTIANAAVGAGSLQLKVSATAITTPISDNDSANTVAGNLAGAINAGGYPVQATVAGAVVTLLYATGRYVHKLSALVISTTGTTATVAAGVLAADNGANHPTLTTALTNIAALPAFPCWATSFADADSLGAMSAFIESQGDGKNQKGQVLHVAATSALADAGAIAPGTSPALTASPRYAVDWCAESPQQAYELAARTAAMVCVEDYAPRNYDGAPLKTNAQVPLLAPARAARSALGDINAAIHSYFMTPLAVDDVSGTLYVVSGKTTSASADAILHDWGTIRHLDYLRVTFNDRLWSLFKGTNLRRNGVPHTPNTVTVDSIRDAAYALALELDALDLYDGAEAFKDGFKTNIDPIVPTRVDCFIPLAVIRSLHQLGVVGAPA